MGKSRSSTVCIAYLMKKFALTPADALARVRSVRPIVEPNAGFMQQLELYHRMKTADDVDAHPIYQRWLYQREVQETAPHGIAPDTSKVRFEDEHVGPAAAAAAAAEDGDEAAAAPELEYRCRRCRRALATSAFVIAHASPMHNAPFPQALTCAHVFVDPLSWMRPQLELGRLDGRLECPGNGPSSPCGAAAAAAAGAGGGDRATVVGRYAWQGMRCSCGAWVAPAMSLTRAKVDEVRVGGGAAADIRRGPGVGMPATRADGRGLL
jgi:dual specificity phosphatase 12